MGRGGHRAGSLLPRSAACALLVAAIVVAGCVIGPKPEDPERGSPLDAGVADTTTLHDAPASTDTGAGADVLVPSDAADASEAGDGDAGDGDAGDAGDAGDGGDGATGEAGDALGDATEGG